MAGHKRILVVPLVSKVEALRMAGGLTLLDDRVTVAVWDELPPGAPTDEQLEALEFAEVPVTPLARDCDALARLILDSDVVYLV